MEEGMNENPSGLFDALPAAAPTRDMRRGKAAPSADTAELAFARAAELARELQSAWERGEPISAETLLLRSGEAVLAHPQAALLVVLEEVRLRSGSGNPPSVNELIDRFPAWEDELRRRLGEPRPPACGDLLHGYRLLAELGSGAQGTVFLALDSGLADRPVVLKVSPHGSEEHLTLARLQHTHIVPLLTAVASPEEGWRVLCMPFLGGATLSAVLDNVPPPTGQRDGGTLLDALDRLQASYPVASPRDGPARRLLSGVSWTDAVAWIGACLADALQFAHDRGLVHLDLKPSNVLLASDGLPLLLDFHLARPPLQPGFGAPGWFGGTPGYMAPEQEAALFAVRAGLPIPAPVDGRADVYGLGMVLFEALGGRRTPQGRPLPLHKVHAEISRGLSDIIAKCLEADPTRRYASGADLADDLRRYLVRMPLRVAPNRSWSERWRNWCNRHPAFAARLGLTLLLTATLVASVLGVWLTLTNRRHEAVADLAEGRELLAEGRPEEAERSFDRGLERTVGLPLSSSLRHDLETERGRARRVRFNRFLRNLTDELRFRLDPETLDVARARRLDEMCRSAWERARQSDLDEDLRTDLLDLAVLSGDLHVRAAADGDQQTARRDAVRLLEEAEERFGPGPVTAWERARHLYALGDPGAQAAETQARQRPARTAWEFAALGRSALRDGDLDKAAEALGEAVQRQPDGLWPNFYQGVCAYKLGEYPEAVEAFRVCVALAPQRAPCRYNRARALAAVNRREEAIRELDRCLELDPSLADAWLARGVQRYETGRLDDALNDLAEARRRGADAAVVAYDRALVHHARKDRAATLAELNECLRHRPDHASARALREQLGP
jgi:serine/threonine protein kinase/Flp pilus assembly protein TadD